MQLSRVLPSILFGCAITVGAVSQSGCRKPNPYKASTWTAQLDDEKARDHATQWLENLGDPSAIPALGQAWEKQAYSGRLLQVIIALARPLTAAEAEGMNLTDFAKTGRKASWDKAMPFLTKALNDVDETNPRSVDSASKAAEAIGESGLDTGLDALISFSQRPLSNKKLLEAHRSAVRSIGKFGATNRAKAIKALSDVVEKDAPPNPSTAKDADQRKAYGEKFEQYLAITSAAINALGDLKSPEAASVLVKAMYRSPELFTQIRRALVASGETAKGELRKVLRGEHADVNALITSLRRDKFCGVANELPPDQCQVLAPREYYATIVLGDFYDPATASEFLAVLKQPAAPAYVFNGSPGPVQHNAVFDALRKIGAAEAAEGLRAVWSDSKAEVSTRAMAMSAYGFVARNGQGVEELAKIADDNAANDVLRQEAATEVGRLATSDASLGALERLADKYKKASDEALAKANGQPKQDYDAAKAEFDAANKVLAKAKADSLALSKDKAASTEALQRAVDAIKAAEKVFTAAKEKEKAAGLVYKPLERQAKDYRSYQRMFQAHIARMAVALRCGDNAGCYADTLKEPKDGSSLTTKVGQYIKDIGSWTDEEKKLLYPATVERAMIELGKRGQAASEYTTLLLDHAVSDDRVVRQSILLALPKIAKVPCDACETKLQAAIKAGEGKSTLAELNVETQMLRNYFSWAGGRSAKAAETPAK